MTPYAELLEFNQPNPIRLEGFTRIRDQFPGLRYEKPYHAPNWEGYDAYVAHDPERIMEFAGRWDYGENNARKLGETVKVPDPNEGGLTKKEIPIIQKYLSMGHESMIEMGDATFFIECSRVVSHEMVRHRIASYQQESQRFVSYKDSNGVMYDVPIDEDIILYEETESLDYGDGMVQEFETFPGISAKEVVDGALDGALDLYKSLVDRGVPKQIARYVLPNAMRTRLIMKTNIREWRHILQLRLDKSAQPEMQELMKQVYDQLVMVFPNALHGVLDNGRGIR